MAWWQLLLLVIVAIPITGALYEWASAMLDRQRYRDPAGDRIAVNGHQLHVHIMGDAPVTRPTVVLEAGVGTNSLDWQLVQPHIAEFARVVAYDRAGYGWSDAGDDPRTPEAIVADLHTLLQRADVSPPFILVGHSFGGIYARQFLATYPDQVVGLILVDSSHPDAIIEQDTAAELERLKGVARFKRVGLMRLVFPRMMHRADYLPELAKTKYLKFMLLDSDNVIREAREMFKGVDLPEAVDVPLTVISRKTDDDSTDDQKWADYQTRLLALAPDARHKISERYSHYLALADPDIVVEAVREMIDNSTHA